MGFFYLILEVFSKLTPDIINKSLKTSKIPTKKGFKFKLYDKNSALIVVLMLNLSKANEAIEKCGNKKDIVHFCCN